MNSASTGQQGGDWIVTEEHGPASDFHGREIELPAKRQLMIFHVNKTALVLGSTQSANDVDNEAAAEIEIVHRRSGGGAVLLEPENNLWIDVVVPRDDVLWNDDVGQATWWLGERWAAALSECGMSDLRVHRGGLEPTPLAKVVCFAGLGPGEVIVGDRKIVGISQRRTRDAARFQCCVLGRFDNDQHRRLLAPGWARVGAGLDSPLPVASFAQLEALKQAFLAQFA